MADKKISALTSASTPLGGTEVLPIVQSGATVKATIANIVGAGTSPGSFTTLANTGLHTNYPQTTIGTTAGSEVIAGRDVSVVGGTAQQVYNKLYRHTAGTNFIGTSWRLQNFADSTAASYLQWGSPTEWNDIGIYNDAGNGLRISTAGNAVVNTGNLVIGTSGQGIDFSATSHPAGMTSELLSDYEEGTWTPTLTRSSSAPTLTYTAQNGYYTKVGNMVTVQVCVTWSANSGGSGYWYLASLPFTVKSATNNFGNAVVGSADGFTYAVGTTQLSAQPTPAQTFCVLTCFGSAVASNVINTVAATGGIYLTATYFTA